jgi:hypothetical protein
MPCAASRARGHAKAGPETCSVHYGTGARPASARPSTRDRPVFHDLLRRSGIAARIAVSDITLLHREACRDTMTILGFARQKDDCALLQWLRQRSDEVILLNSELDLHFLATFLHRCADGVVLG